MLPKDLIFMIKVYGKNKQLLCHFSFFAPFSLFFAPPEIRFLNREYHNNAIRKRDPSNKD